MRLAEDDKMIHALAPDRSEQPYGAQSACDDGAIDAIADDVARHLIPGKCLR